MSKILSLLDFILGLTKDVAKLRSSYKTHQQDYQ
jgi:hypothetical protein